MSLQNIKYMVGKMKRNEIMDFREIENLKTFLMERLREGYRMSIDSLGVDGRIISIGFRPYWTNPGDSKIDKLEFNILKENGKIIPVSLNHLIGYKAAAHGGTSPADSKELNLQLMLYSPNRLDDRHPYDTINLRLYK